jgi:hypothetical protein
MVTGRAVTGLLVLPTAAGCASPEPAALAGADGVTVLATSPTDSAMEALGGGVLTVVDGCLGLEGGEGFDGLVVAWPRGSEPLEDAVGVRVPDGRTFVVGDEVTFGGGQVDADEMESQACEGTAQVWKVGSIPRPTPTTTSTTTT